MPLGISILPNVDISPLDRLLVGPGGLLRPVPAAEVQAFPLGVLQLWCAKRGVYQVPTVELISWLRDRIGDRVALEVCAGNGVLGRALGVTMTDSYVQTLPEMVAYYRALGQEPIAPPPDVIKMDANEAVRFYKPQVVLGAWVTQKYEEGDRDGSVYGVDELDLLSGSGAYIHVGNDGPHGLKRLLAVPHSTYRFDWLVSRAQDQFKNHIKVWAGVS